MRRPRPLKHPSRAAALLLLAGLAGCTRPAPPRGAVLIVVDTLRADRLGLYGSARPTSPNLDRRATRAAVFERAQSSSPWTLPAIGSLLTGQLPTRHGAGARLGANEWAQSRELDARVETLAETLAKAGVRTGAVTNNPFLRPALGLSRGFGLYDHKAATNISSRRADQVVDAGLAFLEREGQGRFFLLLHVFDPHLAYDAPAPFAGRFSAVHGQDAFAFTQPADVRHKLPGLSAGARAYVSAAYDEELAFVDQQLERLFVALERRGLDRSTLVLLTSDHGEELFDHDGFEHGHSTFQELLHVPFVAWGPGVRARREATPISLCDVAPTVLEALGVAPAGAADGASLWPSLVAGQAPARRLLVSEATLFRPERKALLAWPLKLHVNSESGQARLYDLQADPRERHDLAALRKQEVERLARQLEAAMRSAELDAAGRGTRQPGQESLDEELKSLGYVQ